MMIKLLLFMILVVELLIFQFWKFKKEYLKLNQQTVILYLVVKILTMLSSNILSVSNRIKRLYIIIYIQKHSRNRAASTFLKIKWPSSESRKPPKLPRSSYRRRPRLTSIFHICTFKMGTRSIACSKLLALNSKESSETF